MKRDWDIIRDILINLDEKGSEKHYLTLTDFPGKPKAEISYNVEILLEADLIYGQMLETIGPETNNFVARRLTWSGHEFLDAIRSDKVWIETKETILKKGICMTIDLVSSVATSIAKGYFDSAI